MGLTCNTDVYGRTLQSHSEVRYVFNRKLSETEHFCLNLITVLELLVKKKISQGLRRQGIEV
jgi:hypothetical protein